MINNQLYGNQFNPNVMKDLKKIDEKIAKEENPEEITKLKMAKLYRGMELMSGTYGRTYQGYFPY